MESIINAPIQFTATAITEVKRLMTEDGFDNTKFLRVGVKGGGCSGMTYILEFDYKKDNDLLYYLDVDNLSVEMSKYLTPYLEDWLKKNKIIF
jgi:iron-sulfur cluster assembly protein